MSDVFARMNQVLDKIESQVAITDILLKQAHSLTEEAIAWHQSQLDAMAEDVKTI